MAFPAQHRGHCLRCEEWFPEGTLIKASPVKSEGWVHETCPSPLAIDRPVVVCTTCFLIKPCECDE
jgi:hypothetical protein